MPISVIHLNPVVVVEPAVARHGLAAVVATYTKSRLLRLAIAANPHEAKWCRSSLELDAQTSPTTSCAQRNRLSPPSVPRLPTSTHCQDEIVKEVLLCSCTARKSCKAKVLSVGPDRGGMRGQLRGLELRSPAEPDVCADLLQIRQPRLAKPDRHQTRGPAPS